MKQKLLSFLGEFWLSDVERIEDSYVTRNPAVEIFPSNNFFTQGLLVTLIEFADINGYMFFVDAIGGSVRMRIWEDVTL